MKRKRGGSSNSAATTSSKSAKTTTTSSKRGGGSKSSSSHANKSSSNKRPSKKSSSSSSHASSLISVEDYYDNPKNNNYFYDSSENVEDDHDATTTGAALTTTTTTTTGDSHNKKTSSSSSTTVYPPALFYEKRDREETLRTSVLGPLFTHMRHEEIVYDQLTDNNHNNNASSTPNIHHEEPNGHLRHHEGQQSHAQLHLNGNSLNKQQQEQEQEQQDYDDIVQVTEYEPCTIQGYNLMLPVDAMLDPCILDSILSVHTWRDLLTDTERSFLKRFLPVLPPTTGKSQLSTTTNATSSSTTNQTTTNTNNTAILSSGSGSGSSATLNEHQELKMNDNVRRLLSGENYHFGNDKHRMIGDIISGYYHPLVTRERNKVRFLAQKEHQINMCLYNKMIEEKLQREKMEQLGELDEDQDGIHAVDDGNEEYEDDESMDDEGSGAMSDE